MASFIDKIRGLLGLDIEEKNPVEQLKDIEMGGFTQANWFTPATWFTPVDENLKPINFTPAITQSPTVEFTPAVQPSFEPATTDNFTPIEFTPANFTPASTNIPTSTFETWFTPIEQPSQANFTPINTTQTQTILDQSNFTPITTFKPEPLIETEIDFDIPQRLPNVGTDLSQEADEWITRESSSNFLLDIINSKTAQVDRAIADAVYADEKWERDIGFYFFRWESKEIEDYVKWSINDWTWYDWFLQKIKDSWKEFTKEQKLSKEKFDKIVKVSWVLTKEEQIQEKERVADFSPEYKSENEKNIKDLQDTLVPKDWSPKELQVWAILLNWVIWESQKSETYALTTIKVANHVINSSSTEESEKQKAKNLVSLSEDIILQSQQKRAEIAAAGKSWNLDGQLNMMRKALQEKYDINYLNWLNFWDLSNLYIKKDIIEDARFWLVNNAFLQSMKNNPTISTNDLLEQINVDVVGMRARDILKTNSDLSLRDTVYYWFQWSVLSTVFNTASQASATFLEWSLWQINLWLLTDFWKPKKSVWISWDVEELSEIKDKKTSEEMWMRFLKARLWLQAIANTMPEVIPVVASFFYNPAKGLSVLSTVQNINRTSRAINFAKWLWLSSKSANTFWQVVTRAELLTRKISDIWWFVVKWFVEEALVSTQSSTYWSKTDKQLFWAWVLLSTFMDWLWILRSTTKFLQEWKAVDNIVAWNLAAQEKWYEWLGNVSSNVIETAQTLRWELIRLYPDADINSLMKQTISEWVKQEEAIDNVIQALVRDGIITKEIILEKWKFKAIEDINLNIEDLLKDPNFSLSEQKLWLLKEMDALVWNKDVSFNNFFQRLTWLQIEDWTTLLNNITTSPSYKVVKSVAEDFPKWKPITTWTIYTKAEVDEIANNSASKKYKLWTKNEDGSYKYFEETNWWYKLKVEALWDEIWITKLDYTDADIKRMAGEENSFISMAEKMNNASVNSGKWQIYNIPEIVGSGLYKTLENTLSKILC